MQNKSIEKKDEAHSTVEKKAEGHEDWNLEFSEDVSGGLHDGEVGLAAHDDGNEGRGVHVFI